VNMIEHDFSFETLGVLLETFHQLGTLHSLRVSRPVIHVGRRHELPTGGEARNDDWLQVRARSVHCGGVARRAGSQYQQPRMSGFFRHDGMMGTKMREFNSIAVRFQIITRLNR